MLSSKISFASKINICNHSKFREIIKDRQNMKKVIMADMYGETDGQADGHTDGTKKLYTIGIGSCTCYGIVNPNDKTADLFHYNHEPILLEACTKEKENKRGFILGGCFEGINKYFKDALKFFKGMQTSILWGQKNCYTSTCYDPQDDIWYVNVKKDDNSKIKDAEDLRRNFDIINIADGDELFINDKKVDPAEVNQNNENYQTI